MLSTFFFVHRSGGIEWTGVSSATPHSLHCLCYSPPKRSCSVHWVQITDFSAPACLLNGPITHGPHRFINGSAIKSSLNVQLFQSTGNFSKGQSHTRASPNLHKISRVVRIGEIVQCIAWKSTARFQKNKLEHLKHLGIAQTNPSLLHKLASTWNGWNFLN